MARFADILKNAGIPDEDRTALEAIAAKYPNLDDVVVAKAEYDSLQQTFNRNKASLDGWEEFRTKAWDPEHQMTRAQWEAQQESAILKARVISLEAGSAITGAEGEVVDFNKLDEELKTRGFVKADTLKGYAPVADVENKFKVQGANYEYLYSKTAHMPMKAYQEFGVIDPTLIDTVFKLAAADPSQEMLKNPDLAYEAWAGPKRMEKQRADLATQQAAFEKQKAEFEVQKTTAPAPTDSGEGASIPPFQQMHDNPGNNPIDTMKGNATFGSGEYGRRLAQAYKAGELKTVLQ